MLQFNETIRLNIETWFDFSWDENLDDVKSINDHVIFMIEELIFWKLFKQQSVALSSTEVKYVNQTLTCTQIMWIRSVLIEINIKQVILSELIIIFANNQKIIKLTENLVFQKRTKHITIKYHYTRDLIKHENVQLIYKTIDQMIVDELIKSLRSILFKEFVASLDMISVIEASIFSQSIRDEERVDQNHRHEDFVEEHIVDHSDLEKHIADHSDHDERSSTEKHLREHNERRIETHREHSVINERWIEARERQSIIEEHRIDERFDDHK